MTKQISKLRLWLRRTAAVFLLVTGLACSAVITLNSLDRGMIEHTISRSKQIETEFRAAAKYVEDVRSSNGRWPTNDELLAWSERQADAHYPLFIADGEDEALRELGHPPAGAHALGIWRGEWKEYYAPWSGKSTLKFNDRNYYLLKSRNADLGLAGFLAIATLLSAAGIWLRGFRRNQ